MGSVHKKNILICDIREVSPRMHDSQLHPSHQVFVPGPCSCHGRQASHLVTETPGPIVVEPVEIRGAGRFVCRVTVTRASYLSGFDRNSNTTATLEFKPNYCNAEEANLKRTKIADLQRSVCNLPRTLRSL